MSQKELVYLKGFAQGAGKMQTLHALNAAVQLHGDQVRKSGEPYIYHPVRVASELLTLGIQDDIVLASALLHDVMEDCAIDSVVLQDRFGISPVIISQVYILSKTHYKSTKEYYDAIGECPRCSLVKISDRCHNISTMIGGFTREKMVQYIQETDDYVIPLCKHVKNFYPEYSNQVFVMKYHIQSVRDAIMGCLCPDTN